jgi:hypothetical protein
MTEPLHPGLRPISDGLSDILTRLGIPADLDLATLVEDWPEIAGDPFGSMSTPAGYGDGELVLSVSDGTAASLLKFRVGELIGRLDEHFGKGAVTSVRIIVGRPKTKRR